MDRVEPCLLTVTIMILVFYGIHMNAQFLVLAKGNIPNYHKKKQTHQSAMPPNIPGTVSEFFGRKLLKIFRNLILTNLQK